MNVLLVKKEEEKGGVGRGSSLGCRLRGYDGTEVWSGNLGRRLFARLLLGKPCFSGKGSGQKAANREPARGRREGGASSARGNLPPVKRREKLGGGATPSFTLGLKRKPGKRLSNPVNRLGWKTGV